MTNSYRAFRKHKHIIEDTSAKTMQVTTDQIPNSPLNTTYSPVVTLGEFIFSCKVTYIIFALDFSIICLHYSGG